MANMLPSRASETPQERLSGVRATDHKGAVHPKHPERFLRVIAKDTIQGGGKQGSAATEIGLSDGRLSAKLGDGTISLGELEKLGVGYAVRFAREVLRQHGHLATPYDRARELLRELDRIHGEFVQLIEHVGK